MNKYLEIEEALNTYGRPCLNNSAKMCTRACEHFHRIPGIYYEGAQNLAKKGKTVDVVQMVKEAAEYRQEAETHKVPPLDAQLTHLIAQERVEQGERAGCLLYPEAPVRRKVRAPRKTRR